MSIASSYLEVVKEELKQQDTATVFSSRQLKALEELTKRQLPTSRDEAYRRTPFTRRLDALQPSSRAEAGKWSQPLHPPLIESAITIRLLNGRLRREDLPSQLPQGMHLSSLSAAYDSHPNCLQQAFRSPLREEDTFVVLNEAAFGDGFFVYVAPRATVPDLLLLQHASSRKEATASYPRTLVYLDKGAQLNLIDIQSSSCAVHQNSVLEVFCAEDAQLRLCKLQDDSPDCLRIDHTYVMQAAGSRLQSFVFSTGGEILRNNLYVRLSEKHAKASLRGLYLCNEYSHIDNHSTLDHSAAQTHSDQNYKGIISGQARGVFNGRIFMRPGAVEATAYQANKNLLLSPRAKVHTKPQLEIWVDDVRCSHGCTVGQLSEEQFFYLQARGIPQKVAEELLLQAFAEELFAELPNPQLSDYFRSWLKRRLRQVASSK